MYERAWKAELRRGVVVCKSTVFRKGQKFVRGSTNSIYHLVTALAKQ